MSKLEALTLLRDKVRDGDIGDDGYDKFSAIPKRGGGVYGDPNWHDAHRAYWGGSLDAAKALHDAVLCADDPQYGYLVGPQYARIVHPSCGNVCDATSTTPAHAWLLAVLEALIAQEMNDE